jgi:hypothetical protein
LALFVSRGQGSLAKYIDASNRSKGEVYFNTACAGLPQADAALCREDAKRPQGRQNLHRLPQGHRAHAAQTGRLTKVEIGPSEAIPSS